MLRFSLLGPLEVERDGQRVEIAGQKQRAVLASLALNAGRVVPTERLITELWGESPPPTAPTALQNAISQLRKALGADAVVTKAPGYMLEVDRSQVDVHHFEAALDAAKSAPAAERRRRLKDALGMWRGPPLAEFTYESFAQTEIGRLEERRLAAVEDLLEAELELGNAGELVGEIDSLVRDNPLRERLRGQLMRALYGSGRQAEALHVYHETRRVLVDELGIEPSPALQQLHASILRQESTLEPQPVAGIGGDPIAEVLRALMGGRLAMVLGPTPSSANGEVLATRLADAFDCPDEHRGDLTRVSQYVAATQGVGPLYDELHALFSAEPEPGPMETFLARLAGIARARAIEHPLLVSTGYGRSLESAFAAEGEDVDVVAYVAAGGERGKFIHRRPGGRETVIDVPNAYADIALAERPVILKIHGEFDPRPERDREGFVVSEDDYIGYLAQTELANVVPVTLAAKLRRSHLLFLAYPVVEWSLRVFLHRVFADQPISYRSWAILPGAQPIQRELWRQRGVDLYDIPLERFVADLESRLGEVTPA